MINGYSIRKCAKEVKISIPTSFYWRHKILDSIRAFMGVGSVGGVIEVDEVFFRESFKGNYKKSTTFTMPRKSIKEALRVVIVVRPKSEKEVYPRNKFAFFVLWIGQETLLLNLYAKAE